MRTTIIPAQITTVEDKIAGSLNFSQILLLMAPVLLGTLIYALFSPVMKIAPYKLSLFLMATTICIALAIRIKEKIIAEWIGILLRYQIRPRYYLFTKNELIERIVDMPMAEPAKRVNKSSAKDIRKHQGELTIKEMIKLDQAMNSGKLAVSFRLGGKR